MRVLLTNVPRKRILLFQRLLLLSLCLPPTAALSQGQAITVTVDIAKTGAPISKNIYGQFLEHGGDTVNTGIWSEMLVDRKFFYPVATVAPTPPPPVGNAIGNPRFENIPKRWWVPVGGDSNGAATTPMGRWRAQNGRLAPYNVKLWGIGNEAWGDYQMGAMALPQYEIKHNLFAKEMKKIDPTIVLIAGGAMSDVMEGADQARRINGQYVPDYLFSADWTGQLLLHCLPNIDMVSEHYYASGTQHTDMKLGKKVPIELPLSFIELQRAAAVQVRAKYEHYEKYLELIPALRAKTVPIAIDEWAYFLSGKRDSYHTVPAYAWAFHEMFRHFDIFKMANLTFATATFTSNGTEAVLNPTGQLFKMYRDHFGVIPVEVGGNSPQPKPTFPAGGDQPAVNPGSPTYPLDVSAALSEDHKTLTIGVLNPSDAEQNIHLDIRGAALASAGKLWRMEPHSIDAIVKAGSPAEVQVEEQSLGALPATVALRPYSVNIYPYPVQ
jgi:alpha-N-arabinofuranosidase